MRKEGREDRKGADDDEGTAERSRYQPRRRRLRLPVSSISSNVNFVVFATPPVTVSSLDDDDAADDDDGFFRGFNNSRALKSTLRKLRRRRRRLVGRENLSVGAISSLFFLRTPHRW